MEVKAHFQGATVGWSLRSHHEGRELGPCQERGTLGTLGRLVSAVTAVLECVRSRDEERGCGLPLPAAEPRMV